MFFNRATNVFIVIVLNSILLLTTSSPSCATETTPAKQISSELMPLMDKKVQLPPTENGFTSTQILDAIKQQFSLSLILELDTETFSEKIRLPVPTLRNALNALAMANHASWETSQGMVIFKHKPFDATMATLHNKSKLKSIQIHQIALSMMRSFDERQRADLISNGYIPWTEMNNEQRTLMRCGILGSSVGITKDVPWINLPEDQLYFVGGFYIGMNIEFKDASQIHLKLFRHKIQDNLSLLSPLRGIQLQQNREQMPKELTSKSKSISRDGVIRLPDRSTPVYTAQELANAIKDAGKDDIELVEDIKFAPIWFSYNKNNLANQMTIDKMMDLLARATSAYWNSNGQLCYQVTDPIPSTELQQKVLLREQQAIRTETMQTAWPYWSTLPVQSPQAGTENSSLYYNPYLPNVVNYSWISKLPSLPSLLEKGNPTSFLTWNDVSKEWQNVIMRGLRDQAQAPVISYISPATAEQARQKAAQRSAKLARYLWDPHGMANVKVQFTLGVIAKVADLNHSWGIKIEGD